MVPLSYNFLQFLQLFQEVGYFLSEKQVNWNTSVNFIFCAKRCHIPRANVNELDDCEEDWNVICELLNLQTTRVNKKLALVPVIGNQNASLRDIEQ